MRERGEERGTKLVGEWRGTFALAASDVGDEMTNNGRSAVGGFAFLAVGRTERGKWMLPLRAKLQSPSMGFVLGFGNCEYSRNCL